MGRTNIVLDDRLVRMGLKITRCRTKRDLVHLALQDLVARRRRKKILTLEGRISWRGDLARMRKGHP